VLNIFVFSIILFIVGISGVLISKYNSIVLLICIELLILSININFVAGALHLDDLLGFIYTLINLTAAASESALGLAILLIYHRIKGGISLDLLIFLKA